MSSSIRFFISLLPTLLLISGLTSAQRVKNCTFDKIFQFGDEISDTGNWIREIQSTPWAGPYANSPYNNTGRASNGLLMIDYIAMASGLPHLLPPYKDAHADFSRGVNFAVAGSTAMSSQELLDMYDIWSRFSVDLNLQFKWMSDHVNSIGGTIHEDQNNLFVVGGIGGNDYLNGILEGKQVGELLNMAPDVIVAIMAAVRKTVLEYGAKKVVVPGILPIGCLPIYKTILQTNSSEAYDENHCLNELNEFAKYHNDQLLMATITLARELGIASIEYCDYFYGYQSLLQQAKDEGFETEKACCGIGGKYNFDMDKRCGSDQEVPVCPDPERYLSWDGLNLTQEAYKRLADWSMHSLAEAIVCQDFIDHD